MISDTALYNKFIVPFRDATVLKVNLKPKSMDGRYIFYLKRTGEDQYDMSGITRSTVVPTSIKLLFGTNATSAVVNFSDYSLFPGLIQDTGGEITRGADVEYSFVRITNDGVLQLEGNAYGDYLEITPLVPNTEEYDFGYNNEALAMFENVDRYFEETPFIRVETDAGYPVQLAFDLPTNQVWAFYCGDLSQSRYGTINAWGFVPAVSKSVRFDMIGLLDTVLFDDYESNMVFEGFVIKGLLFNKEKTELTALVQSSVDDAEKTIPLVNASHPVVTFSELTAYLMSSHHGDVYLQFLGTEAERRQVAFEKKFLVPSRFSFSFDSLKNNAGYAQGWSVTAKEKALAIGDAVKRINANAVANRLSVATTSGSMVSTSNTISIDYSIDGVSQPPLQYTTSMTARVLFFDTIYGFDKILMAGVTAPAGGTPAYEIWSEVSGFLNLYANQRVKLSYLPPALDGETMRVEMKNTTTGEVFIGVYM
jgi:hypothetical protein